MPNMTSRYSTEVSNVVLVISLIAVALVLWRLYPRLKRQ